MYYTKVIESEVRVKVKTTILTTEGKEPSPIEYELDDSDIWNSLGTVLYEHETKELEIVNAKLESVNAISNNDIIVDCTWFGKIAKGLIYGNNKKIKLGRQITCKPTAENVPLREQGVLLDAQDGISYFKTIFDGVLFLEYFNNICKKELENIFIDLDYAFGFKKGADELDTISLETFQKLINMFCDNMKLIFGNQIPPIIFPELTENKEWYEYC